MWRPDPPVSLRRAGACHNAPGERRVMIGYDSYQKTERLADSCIMVDRWVAPLGGKRQWKTNI